MPHLTTPMEGLRLMMGVSLHYIQLGVLRNATPTASSVDNTSDAPFLPRLSAKGALPLCPLYDPPLVLHIQIRHCLLLTQFNFAI
jgi:hypothetical protein